MRGSVTRALLSGEIVRDCGSWGDWESTGLHERPRVEWWSRLADWLPLTPENVWTGPVSEACLIAASSREMVPIRTTMCSTWQARPGWMVRIASGGVRKLSLSLQSLDSPRRTRAKFSEVLCESEECPAADKRPRKLRGPGDIQKFQTSFLPQRYHRVHLGGSSPRNIRSTDRHTDQEQRYQTPGPGIVRFHAIEKNSD